MKNKELMLANLRYMQEVVDAQKPLPSTFRHILNHAIKSMRIITEAEE